MTSWTPVIVISILVIAAVVGYRMYLTHATGFGSQGPVAPRNQYASSSHTDTPTYRASHAPSYVVDPTLLYGQPDIFGARPFVGRDGRNWRRFW